MKQKPIVDYTTWLCGPPPATGQFQRYPSRFISNLIKAYPISGLDILEMFSGSSSIGMTTDIRPETGCDHPAPYDDLPFEDEIFDMVIADPPYNMGFANQWITHKKDLPRPKRILKEAVRVVRPNGLILILHIIIIPPYKDLGVYCIARHPVLAGANNAIRLLNVFRKLPKELELDL